MNSFKEALETNFHNLQEWAKRTNTNCYRIYDREVAEFPLAIDFYAGRFCVHYFAPNRQALVPSEELIKAANEVLTALFKCPLSRIYWRVRIKEKQTRQYEKVDALKEFFNVLEHGVKFKINLRDYLDTGLFLDHRLTRQRVAALAKNKKLLNLFAYTSSFSVHAAKHGAKLTKSVDLSNTYVEWGKENFRLNGLDPYQNPIIRADCLPFLEKEMRLPLRYDLIVIDPPTISRSKKMKGMFDVQKEYISLINNSLKLLDKEGILFFSTNSRNFKFDEAQIPHSLIQEITQQTIPQDFRDKKIHRCWEIRHEKP